MRIKTVEKKLRHLKNFIFLFKVVLKTKSFFQFLDFLMYRTPLGYRWSRLRGYRFHKSTIVWLNERNGVHTRLVFLLPRLMFEFPDIKSVAMAFELYDEEGRAVKKWFHDSIPVYKEYVIDSQTHPEIPKNFHGSIWVKQTLDIEDRLFFKWAKGLFSVASTYVEYYCEGSFITVTHDYSAFFPDQGIHYKPVGMIPAYCDDARETHVVIHAATSGIAAKDIELTLFNKKGERQTLYFPPLRSFAMRRFLISELFPNARKHLEQSGGIGILSYTILNSSLLATAFLTVDRKSQALSIEHTLEVPNFPRARLNSLTFQSC